MADGSVVIGVSLDTASFAASVAVLEAQVVSMGARLTQSLSGGYGLEAAASAMLAGVGESIAAMTAEVGAAVEGVIQSAQAAFTGADWSSAGASVAGALAAGIQSGGGAVLSAVQESSSSARQGFSADGWSSIGYNMMSGVAAGIRSAGASVVQAIREVSEETKAAVEAYYQISSPSALMRDEVGVMISRGIAEGILDGEGYIRSAVVSAASAASLPPISGASAAGGAVQGHLKQNIYLRDSDTSPYRTARAIRRESETMLRLT